MLASAVILTVSVSVSVVFAKGVTVDGANTTLLLSKVVKAASVVRVVFAYGGRGAAMVALLVLLLMMCQ